MVVLNVVFKFVCSVEVYIGVLNMYNFILIDCFSIENNLYVWEILIIILLIWFGIGV